MIGYIYITGRGADPERNKRMTDPIFGSVPTLGACMPNVRASVSLGDWIFVVSGKCPDAQQYVIGGMKVAEKITALAAHGRFPENRLRRNEDGLVVGNIAVDAHGNQHRLDTHRPDTLENRIRNYIVGSDAIVLSSEAEIGKSRQGTLKKVSELVNRPMGNRAIDIIGRSRKLDDVQVMSLIGWLEDIKSNSV